MKDRFVSSSGGKRGLLGHNPAIDRGGSILPHLFGAGLFGDPIKQRADGMLASKFVVPPFTVLDARKGDWQQRKRAWLRLGITSELGRGENSAPGGALRPAARLGSTHQNVLVFVKGDGRKAAAKCGGFE